MQSYFSSSDLCPALSVFTVYITGNWLASHKRSEPNAVFTLPRTKHGTYRHDRFVKVLYLHIILLPVLHFLRSLCAVV